MSSGLSYPKSLVQHFWDYVEEMGALDEALLDSEQRDEQRPPVYKKENEAHNLLYPPGATHTLRAAIEATLPPKERHRWFRSMKSSQAVAQSVFGNLIVGKNLGLLAGLKSDQGLPAFSDDLATASTQLEYSVKHLGEPRSTSIDLWIEGSHRIAVECKLTEADFGTCSRPRLKEGKDRNHLRDHCDGSYTRQRARQSRCSLTEIGVKYWEFTSNLFDWDGDKNLILCPLRNTYQLVRNVLAACVTPDGRIDTNNAHVLIIYDARNPSFQDGGVAHSQWKTARAALKEPQLLRSCSWQSLVEHLSLSGEVTWLVDQLKRKYGF